MQPITTPDGVTFIRDDFKAPLWTLDACFDFMKAARAKRKIIVIGTLSDGMSFDPQQCILVYDDLDLPLGTVRTRLSGSAGGHRGVASILEAFQTDRFRRVKVGVGQVGIKLDRATYVTKPFDAASGETVEKAIAAAVAKLLEIAKAQADTKDGAKVL